MRPQTALPLAAALSLGMIVTVPSTQAADPIPLETPQPVETREIVFDFGGGVTMSPKFPASKIYTPGGLPLFGLQFLRLPVFGEVVTGEEKLFTIYPSFDYIQERSVSDAAYLRGIPNRDFSIELGPGAAFRYGPFRAFAEARYGVTGHNGFVGNVGVDYVAQPFEKLEVSIGPRMQVASDNYMETYFGVPASAVELNEYDPSGGIKDLGASVLATYELTEKVRIVGRARYRHFVGEALDSPIVEAGNDQEIELGIGLTYRFGFDLWQ